MKIILYSTNCPKCNIIKLKLQQLHLDYTLVEDVDTTVDIAKQHNIKSAPILQVDDKFYDFNAAVAFLKEVK